MPGYTLQENTVKKLSQLNIQVFPHSPYSPEISPTDYHLFKHLVEFLIGKIFQKGKRIKDAFYELIDSRCSEFFF